MKTATIREIRNSFPTVARWIEEGECVVITKSGKPFARLAPIPPESKASLEMPDFMARMKEEFPDESVTTGGALLDYDRGDR
jgi:antitoxin (DNA-binding transcriptional repressor) of toxin-antitoxin stability system